MSKREKTMSLQLAPRPANEERRVQAVHRTGVIDSGQNTHFSVFCEIAKEVTGFEYIAFSLFDETFQCKISTTNNTDNQKGERNEFNICSYVLLSSEPTLIPDLRNHNKWKDHPAVLSGDGYLGYAGFPVINKDNYALGTFCLLDKKPKSLSDTQIKLVKGLADRIAHQLDIQTDQKELTADAMQKSVKIFHQITGANSFEQLEAFLAVCSGHRVGSDEYQYLVKLNLVDEDPSAGTILNKNGISLQTKMNLQTRIMRRHTVNSDGKANLLDDLLGDL